MNTGRITNHTCNRQRGLALVESVVVLPLVIVIMLAVAELGNVILQYNTLTQSVRDGARFLAGAPNGTGGSYNVDPQDVQDTQHLVAYGTIGVGEPILPGFTPGDVDVQDMGDGNVSVTGNYEYQPLLIGGIPNLMTGGTAGGGVFTMRAGIIMRVLL